MQQVKRLVVNSALAMLIESHEEDRHVIALRGFGMPHFQSGKQLYDWLMSDYKEQTSWSDDELGTMKSFFDRYKKFRSEDGYVEVSRNGSEWYDCFLRFPNAEDRKVYDIDQELERYGMYR
jgi:hypothetical protein